MSSSSKDRQQVQLTLERKVLHGAAAEWDLVQWRIPEHLRRRLHKPQFRVSEMRTTWGHWAAGTNTITLSRRLARLHPWDAIRDVLLHEVAHQIAHAMAGDDPAAPHGKAFQEACRLIGAAPRASGDYPLLHDRLSGAATTRDDTKRLKIKKLLALSRSTNPNEAAVALAKARELMVRFQIPTDDLHRANDDTYISVFVDRPALRHTRDHTHLGGLLADFYFVEVIWVPAWVLEKEKVGCALEISGLPANVQMAGYVYDYVKRFVATQWQAYSAGRKMSRYRKTDYAVGIIQGFRSLLERQHCNAAAATNHRALIPMSDPQLVAYVKQKYPRLRTVRTRATQADAGVIQDGHRAGRKLRITPPVSGAAAPTLLAPQRGLPSPDKTD